MRVPSLIRRLAPVYVHRFGQISGGWMIYIGPWRTRVVLNHEAQLTGGRFPNGSAWFSGWHRVHAR